MAWNIYPGHSNQCVIVALLRLVQGQILLVHLLLLWPVLVTWPQRRITYKQSSWLTSKRCSGSLGKDSVMNSSNDLDWLDEDFDGAGFGEEDTVSCCFCCSFWSRLSFLMSLAFRHRGLLGSAPLPRIKKTTLREDICDSMTVQALLHWITPVFRVTWSFRNHSNIRIWCLKKHFFLLFYFNVYSGKNRFCWFCLHQTGIVTSSVM